MRKWTEEIEQQYEVENCIECTIIPRADLTSAQSKELGESLLCWADAQLGTEVLAVCDWYAVEDLLLGELPQPYCLRNSRESDNSDGFEEKLVDNEMTLVSPEIREYLRLESLVNLTRNTPASDAMLGNDQVLQDQEDIRVISLWIAPAYINPDRIANGLRRYVCVHLLKSARFGDQQLV